MGPGAYHPGEKRLLDHADGLGTRVADQRTRWEAATLLQGDDAGLLPPLTTLAEDLFGLVDADRR